MTTSIWTAGVGPVIKKTIEQELQESSFLIRNQSIRTVKRPYLSFYVSFLLFPPQNRTSCCSGALCPARSHKREILWVLWRSVLLIRHRLTHNSDHAVRLPTSCVVGDLLFGADHVGPGEGLSHLWTVVVERSMRWRKNITLLFVGRGKTSSCVNSDTPSARNLQISSHCLFDLTLSVQLDEPAWIFQLFSFFFFFKNNCYKMWEVKLVQNIWVIVMSAFWVRTQAW